MMISRLKLVLMTGLSILAAAPGLAGQVSFERLVNASSEPDAWLTYSGDYSSHRYSALGQINTSNVSRLRPAWLG